MTAADRYATPTAFRRALTDRLKTLAGTSRWTEPQLQRHVAYDRLLERLYQFDRDWVVKGATALMARELGTRGTLDIDLYREISLVAAEAGLRHAATADIGDWSIVTGASVPAAEQLAALVSELDRRQIDLPQSFDVPDRRLWEPGYAAEARRSLLHAGRTLNEALTLVKSFIDPLLNQTATGHWDQRTRQWLET